MATKLNRKEVKRTMSREVLSKQGRLRKAAMENEAARREELTYKVLSEDHANKLYEITDIKDIERYLQEHFSLFDNELDLKEGVILDYYTAAVWWSMQQKMTQFQMPAFFTIVHTLFENVKENSMNAIENLLELKKLIAMAQSKPELFSESLCKQVIDYVSISFFQHYRLFEFIFSLSQGEEIIGADLQIEVLPASATPYPMPLCEAVTEEVYHEYMVTRTPTPSEEEVPEEAAKEALLAADIVDLVTAEDIREIFQEVCTALLQDARGEVVDAIHSREAELLARINKIHKVST